ncbi:hypothetical protein [Alteromonas sp. KUL49]|uniref:hypothetical protein n=1 Tax=Alteromonas sp. KUL49 TaxID=2480798 RepID=UPI00102F0C26|nr:hypothetical protein [Alteromonas sp. KUL49]TAP39688.1 hypothetical protein EYS00_10180 [Alteromonas sp. KUL49]GEA11676.1 hypothetical protein KUL49_20510 [Alteromonas sp. KUL49]
MNNFSHPDHKVAVIGTGGSAKALLEHEEINGEITYFSSMDSGSFNGRPIHALSSMLTRNFDAYIVAIYDYSELLEVLEKLPQNRLYWFDNTQKKLVKIGDLYNDKNQLSIKESQILTVIYDFRVTPPTYDFLNFMVHAKLTANKLGLTTIKVIFCPGDKAGFREDISFFSIDEMNFRFNNLLLPLISLVDKHANFSVCRTREEARLLYRQASHRFPLEHNFLRPKAVHFFDELLRFHTSGTSIAILESSAFYQEKVKSWASARKITLDKTVVVTLRECDAHHERNSHLPTWKSVCMELISKGMNVVVIRDTEKALLPLNWDGVYECSEAALSVHMRFALYELCHINLMTSNGAQALVSLSPRCKYILFGMLNPSCTSNTVSHLTRIGIVPGSDQRISAREGQYLDWNAITTESVMAAMNRFFNV